MAAYALAFALILAFTLVSGFNDGGNLLAVFLGNRGLRTDVVVLLMIGMTAAGPLLAGTAVARTIGVQIVDVRRVGLGVLNVALVATLATLMICWRLGIPTSTSFALVGGLSGAGLATAGAHAVIWTGVLKALASLILAVVLGAAAGYAAYALARLVLRGASLNAGVRAGQLQYLSSALVCFGYGANDAEKSVGLFATCWMLAHGTQRFSVHGWMIGLTTAVFAAGLLTGGLRVARTVGYHVFRMRPVHGLCTQAATAAVVLTAAALGGPVSTTQTVDSAIVGVGTRADKARGRGEVLHRFGGVWVGTTPAAFGLSAVLALAARAVHLLP
ncbi:MAG: inorganic phosphate transporter [Alicyclobacillus sp.]|nr:inorganic phosphate transporter [Alicyclobacillus sp.]